MRRDPKALARNSAAVRLDEVGPLRLERIDDADFIETAAEADECERGRNRGAEKQE